MTAALRKICTAWACVLPFALGCSVTFASARPDTETAMKVAEAVPVDRAPAMDGTLNDALWEQAKRISDFQQREPDEGQVPTEATEVRILYTKRGVYFGIKCLTTDPASITATELRRDVSQLLDDSFEIVVDSAHDRRNAYVFQVNPLGTQRDALITEERKTRLGFDDGDPGWDGIWTSQARITDAGWTATIAIPFATFNFMQSRDVVWGINFKRFIRQKNEEDLWSAWRRVDGATRISQAGELHGISNIGSGRLFIVKPYALAGFSHLPSNATGTELKPGTTALKTGGVDVKLGLRSNLVANLTVNTDFADADVDTQTFNLSPYKLFYPEKRQFFLENAGVFSSPIGGGGEMLFFSRQIGIDSVSGEQVPINAGGKVTGSLGKFELGVMDVNTRGSAAIPGANYALVRAKRALWGGSYLGVTGIDKRSGNPSDRFNQGSGADTRLVFFKDLVVAAFAAQTRTPGISSGQTNAGLGFNYQTNWLEAHGERRKIGQHFNPEVGFMERADCICTFLDANFKPRPKLQGVRELSFEGMLFHAPDTRHVLQSQEWQSTFRIEFNNGAYTDDDIVNAESQRLVDPFNVYKNVYIPVGQYSWKRHQLSYGSPLDHKVTVNLMERFGGYYNGRMNEARVRAAYRPNEKLSFELAEQWNRFRLPIAGGNFSVLVGNFQTNYSFSRFLMLSGLVQMNTANTQALNANFRLRWNYRPDSDLYVIYTAGQRFASEAATVSSQFYEHSLVLKYTYSWRP